jgi:hypothetical protein
MLVQWEWRSAAKVGTHVPMYPWLVAAETVPSALTLCALLRYTSLD